MTQAPSQAAEEAEAEAEAEAERKLQEALHEEPALVMLDGSAVSEREHGAASVTCSIGRQCA